MRHTAGSLGAFAARLRNDRIALAAAGVTYHLFLAVFPFLFAAVAAVAIAGHAISEDAIRSTIEQVTPPGADAVLLQAVSQARQATDPQGQVAIWLAIALGLLSASSGMAALLQGLEVASGSAPRLAVRRRVLGLALVVTTLVLAAIGVAAGVALGSVIRSPAIATAAHWTLAMAVVVAVLVTIRAVRRRDEPLLADTRWSLGSTLAAVGILAASVGLSIFASRLGGSFARTYGTFTSIVVLMLWFYAVAFVVLAGEEVDAVGARGRRVRSADGLGTHGRGMPQIDRGRLDMDRDKPDLGTPTSYRCDLCAEAFGAEQELREHWERVHAGELVGAASDQGTGRPLGVRR